MQQKKLHQWYKVVVACTNREMKAVREQIKQCEEEQNFDSKPPKRHSSAFLIFVYVDLIVLCKKTKFFLEISFFFCTFVDLLCGNVPKWVVNGIGTYW